MHCHVRALPAVPNGLLATYPVPKQAPVQDALDQTWESIDSDVQSLAVPSAGKSMRHCFTCGRMWTISYNWSTLKKVSSWCKEYKAIFSCPSPRKQAAVLYFGVEIQMNSACGASAGALMVWRLLQDHRPAVSDVYLGSRWTHRMPQAADLDIVRKLFWGWWRSAFHILQFCSILCTCLSAGTVGNLRCRIASLDTECCVPGNMLVDYLRCAQQQQQQDLAGFAFGGGLLLSYELLFASSWVMVFMRIP